MDLKKANKDDLDSTKTLITNLNERVKHLSILQSQISDFLAPMKDNLADAFDLSAKRQMQAKVQEIQHQTNIVNSWIN